MIRTIIILFIIFISASFSEAADTAKAPDFELPDTNGITHRFSDYRGKIVLINFWASWCRECVLEIPSLNSLHEKFKKSDVVILGISIDRDLAKASDTIAENWVAFPVLMDAKGEVFVKKYSVIGFPTTILIDQKGFIRQKFIGRHDFSSSGFIEKINNMLKEK